MDLVGANHLTRDANKLSNLVAGHVPNLMFGLDFNYSQIKLGPLQSAVQGLFLATLNHQVSNCPAKMWVKTVLMIEAFEN
jgi:hypothetical protein